LESSNRQHPIDSKADVVSNRLRHTADQKFVSFQDRSLGM